MAENKDDSEVALDDDKAPAGTPTDTPAETMADISADPATDGPAGESAAQPAEIPDVATGDDPVMDALLAERDSLKDQLLRALADVENMRRRTERELESARKYAHTGFARDLVGAIDNLSRAIAAAPPAGDAASADDAPAVDAPAADAISSLITGLELSWTEIQSTMERHGIKRVDPKGEKFDYNLHQAMFEVPSEEYEPGIVVEVIQHGYVLHDRLLRPAMVGVAKAADAAPPESE
jgi:molecular chaperone GrpE